MYCLHCARVVVRPRSNTDFEIPQLLLPQVIVFYALQKFNVEKGLGSIELFLKKIILS